MTASTSGSATSGYQSFSSFCYGRRALVSTHGTHGKTERHEPSGPQTQTQTHLVEIVDRGCEERLAQQEERRDDDKEHPGELRADGWADDFEGCVQCMSVVVGIRSV